ncbi:MAG: hypothetical protein ACRCTZ_16085 [Sarcina sp.]
MSYLQYLSLTMGTRWLIGYIKSDTSARSAKDECKKEMVEFKYTMVVNIILLFMNYVSYKLLACGLPPFIKMIREMI